MIDDDLINKFDSIEDLPISEEMLGAYMEGNLDRYEMENMQGVINSHSSVQHILGDTSADFMFNTYEPYTLEDSTAFDDDNHIVLRHDIYDNVANNEIDPELLMSNFPEDESFYDPDSDNFFNQDDIELPDIPFF